MAGIIRWKDPLVVIKPDNSEVEGKVIFEIEIEDGQVLEEENFEFIKSLAKIKGFEGFNKKLEKQILEKIEDMEYEGDYDSFVIYL